MSGLSWFCRESPWPFEGTPLSRSSSSVPSLWPVALRPSSAMDSCPSRVVDVDNRSGEDLRGFLRQIVTNAAFDEPMRVLACEPVGVGRALRVRRSIGVALERDRGHMDDRARAQSLLQLVELRLARGQAESPAIVVDHDADVVR